MSEEKPNRQLEEKATVKDYLTVEKEDDQELLKYSVVKEYLTTGALEK